MTADKIVVIDDFVTKSYQEEIKNLMLGDQFPWFFTADVTDGSSAPKSSMKPAMFHIFKGETGATSNYFNFLLPMAFSACDKINFNYKEIVKCRSFLQFPILEKSVDKLHVDYRFPHVVLLYYVIDAEGDTIIVDKKHQQGIPDHHLEVGDNKILARVTPKQGRAVIFNGAYYHTAEQSSSGMRCVINFDIV